MVVFILKQSNYTISTHCTTGEADPVPKLLTQILPN